MCDCGRLSQEPGSHSPPFLASRHRPRNRVASRFGIGLFAFFVFLGFLSTFSTSIGLSWDETTYLGYSYSIDDWVDAGMPLSHEALVKFWNNSPYHNPHPPFLRIASYVSESLLGGILPFPLGYRIGVYAVIALLLAIPFKIATRHFGVTRTALLFGFILFQPRVFGHMLIASNDGATAACWIAMLFACWQVVEAPNQHRHAALLIGIAAVATACKFTAFLALAPCSLVLLVSLRRRGLTLSLLMLTASFALLVLTTPHIWHHPIQGIYDYLQYPFTRKTIPITTFYLGQPHNVVMPWHYPIVMGISTTPPLVLLAALATFWPAVWKQKLTRITALFFLFWCAIAMTPSSPKHDEVRQFIAVFPILGVLAWIGFEEIRTAIASGAAALTSLKMAPKARGFVSILAFILLLAPWVQARKLPLSYYNMFIGGLPGAERAGMELTLYFEAIHSPTLAALNALPPKASIGLFPGGPMLLEAYQAYGLLRNDLVLVYPFGADGKDVDFVLMQHRRSVLPDNLYFSGRRIHELFYQGVSIVRLVDNRPQP